MRCCSLGLSGGSLYKHGSCRSRTISPRPTALWSCFDSRGTQNNHKRILLLLLGFPFAIPQRIQKLPYLHWYVARLLCATHWAVWPHRSSGRIGHVPQAGEKRAIRIPGYRTQFLEKYGPRNSESRCIRVPRGDRPAGSPGPRRDEPSSRLCGPGYRCLNSVSIDGRRRISECFLGAITLFHEVQKSGPFDFVREP